MKRAIKYGFMGMVISYIMIWLAEESFFIGLSYELIAVIVILSSIICGCTGKIVDTIEVSNRVRADEAKELYTLDK